MKNYNWVENLSEVGAPIIRDIERIESRIKELKKLERLIEEMKADLDNTISEHWSEEEIRAAKEGA